MIWAIVDNEKIEPRPKTIGKCPHCKKKVHSRCGPIKVWHWAHFKDELCDQWFEPESFWHKHWKMTFGKENVEVRIKKDGEMHIADIQTVMKVVIELQNSPIPNQIIKEREEFYGEQMIWLVNGEKFKKNLFVKDYWEDQEYHQMMSLPRPPVRWLRSMPEITKGINGQFFRWKYPRKSWKDVKRPVFIDFGKNTLFWVKEGMGRTQIRGTFISKEKFIKKYGGNYDYYCQHQLNDIKKLV